MSRVLTFMKQYELFFWLMLPPFIFNVALVSLAVIPLDSIYFFSAVTGALKDLSNYFVVFLVIQFAIKIFKFENLRYYSPILKISLWIYYLIFIVWFVYINLLLIPFWGGYP